MDIGPIWRLWLLEIIVLSLLGSSLSGAVPQSSGDHMWTLDTFSSSFSGVADPRLLVEEVEVICVCLVSRVLSSTSMGSQARHEENVVRKVTNKSRVTCRWEPAHMSKSRSFFCGICVQAGGGVVLDCSYATDPDSTSGC